MRRYRKTLAVAVLGFALVLYREWVMRTKPPIFLPLGFFEVAIQVQSPEDEARDEASWVDPVRPLILEDDAFEKLSIQMDAVERSVGVLVTGPTLGGFAAALASAGEGVPTLLATRDDWEKAMRSEAAHYLLHRDGQPALSNKLELDLARHVEAARMQISTGDVDDSLDFVVSFFRKRADEAQSLQILDNHALVGFARDKNGRLDRALFKPTNGTGAVALRFEYLIDATRDGATMALAGVPTVASWSDDDATVESDSLPRPALSALARGYTQSGRMVPGIGKRLENASVQLTIVDRGFHGAFTPVTDHDSCWQRDNATQPFMTSGSVLLRAKDIGCLARATVHSSFEDSVELFFVNHGNDAVEASVRMGDTTVNVKIHANPAQKFVRLGAFPVGPESPITIDFRSALPTDRIEGVIARKLNTGSPGTRMNLNGGASAKFAANNWLLTEYDAYLVTDSSNDTSSISIDGAVREMTRVGQGTFAANGLLLRNGTHEIRVPDGIGRHAFVLVPVRPGSNRLPVEPVTDANERSIEKYPEWIVRPKADAEVLFTVPANACASECTYVLIEQTSMTVMLEGHSTRGSELIAPVVPVGKVALEQGETYVFMAQGEYDERAAPTVFPIKDSAVLHNIGGGGVHVEPTRAGMLYDVWVRPVRSSRSVVTAGAVQRTLNASDRWQYAMTEPLSFAGASVTAGGTVELLAIPNVTLDSYHVPLNRPPSPPSRVTGLPAGAYAVASYGAQNPVSVTAKGDNGSVQVLKFDGEAGAFASMKPYMHAADAGLAYGSAWPQRLILYERINRPEDAIPIISGASLTTIDPRPWSRASRDSRGTLLFDARPKDGTGPVTIAGLHASPTDERIETQMMDAFLLFRMGKTTITPRGCDAASDPQCDARRYSRAPTDGPPNDAEIFATHPEGRRLRGRDVLTASGAYAEREQCSSCQSECVVATMSGSTCVLIERFTMSPDTILSIAGSSGPTSIMSPRESLFDTLTVLLNTMRRDGLISGPTHLETVPPARNVTLTLGMLVAEGHENVLPGSTTVSATFASAKALRTPATEMAIGDAVGHVAAFSLRHEYAPLWLIAKSPDAMARLRRHLVGVGVRVMPVEGRDELGTKAIQRRVLDGRGDVVPVWRNDRIAFDPTPLTEDERFAIFGGDDLRTVGEALVRLPGISGNEPIGTILRLGLEIGFLNEKIINLHPNEIMALPLDDSFLLKADYLFRTMR